MKLTALHFALDAVEVGGYSVHTGWVANEYHTVGQLFRTQMQMKTRTIRVDDEF